ncbi:MAG: aliphatic sulfonate ABC transporter substrate-binding protein [Liquorilactobacillus hordei]|uniref:aliphatic sulfonate ABC transporter substrate-binding protein n=1 Tax=Liquorilactobacillus hordei TaxID=468911 RepID=UPI0039EB80A6
MKNLKKSFIVVLLLFWCGVAVYGWHLTREDAGSSSLKNVVVGYQAGDEFYISKIRGKFVKKMKAKGYNVKFKEFQNGAAMMQALASGNVDYARVGDTPPVSALASGTKLTYVAAGGTKAKGSGILVHKNSTIKSLADLKGKKVAYTKGTSSQYMLLRALKVAGLSNDDITWVNLDSDAASVAYSKGKVDAWANWDPSVAQVEITENSKLLVDGTTTKALNRSFIVSPTTYASKNKTLSKLIIKYTEQDMKWANKNHSKLIKKMSADLKLSKKVVSRTVNRRTFSMHAMTKSVVKEEQEIANVFYDNNIITKKVNISKYVQYLK